MIDFSNLDSTMFEELCFDILTKKGFTNISWRKGTGKKSSPADSGRDISATLLKKEFDGSEKLERYFFECKHYLEGVPPTAIESALSWASAERPDYLIIVSSNFLSNPCKDYIDDYKENNRPAFEIRTWENKVLEVFLSDMPDICAKWRIQSNGFNLRYINKYHLAYVLKPKLNTVEFLVDLLDNFDPKIRDSVLSLAYIEIINPRFRTPISGKETMGDLMIDKISYEVFREKVIQIGKRVQHAFVHEIMSEALSWAYLFGDISEQDIVLTRNKRMRDHIAQKIESKKEPEKKEDYLRMLEFIEKGISELPTKYAIRNKEYNVFCDSVIAKLLEEPEKSIKQW